MIFEKAKFLFSKMIFEKAQIFMFEIVLIFIFGKAHIFIFEKTLNFNSPKTSKMFNLKEIPKSFHPSKARYR